MNYKELACWIFAQGTQYQDENGYFCRETICEQWGLTKTQWLIVKKELELVK